VLTEQTIKGMKGKRTKKIVSPEQMKYKSLYMPKVSSLQQQQVNNQDF
jgi:hypothetical protein